MKIIKKMSHYIEEEIHDSKKYAKAALKWKLDFPEVAEMFYNLSLEETRHMTILHNMVEKIIKAYREEHGDPPVEMMAVYDYLHEQAIEKAAEAKSYQDMYKQ